MIDCNDISVLHHHVSYMKDGFLTRPLNFQGHCGRISFRSFFIWCFPLLHSQNRGNHSYVIVYNTVYQLSLLNRYQYFLLHIQTGVIYNRVGKCGSRSVITITEAIAARNNVRLIGVLKNLNRELTLAQQVCHSCFIDMVPDGLKGKGQSR